MIEGEPPELSSDDAASVHFKDLTKEEALSLMPLLEAPPSETQDPELYAFYLMAQRTVVDAKLRRGRTGRIFD